MKDVFVIFSTTFYTFSLRKRSKIYNQIVQISKQLKRKFLGYLGRSKFLVHFGFKI